MNNDNVTPNSDEYRLFKDQQWEKYKEQWRATYKRHHPSSGWATLGAEVINGICHCPVCLVVRVRDKK